jgi:hypothetical protein
MDRKQFGALLGFLFVAAWIVLNFGYAFLCLIGAAVFYFVASYLEGDVDLVELQSRFSPQGGIGAPVGPQAPAAARPPVAAPAGRPPGSRPRVR